MHALEEALVHGALASRRHFDSGSVQNTLEDCARHFLQGVAQATDLQQRLHTFSRRPRVVSQQHANALAKRKHPVSFFLCVGLVVRAVEITCSTISTKVFFFITSKGLEKAHSNVQSSQQPILVHCESSLFPLQSLLRKVRFTVLSLFLLHFLIFPLIVRFLSHSREQLFQ